MKRKTLSPEVTWMNDFILSISENAYCRDGKGSLAGGALELPG